VAISDSPLLVRLGTLLSLPGSALVIRNSVDGRTGILVLLLTLAVAFAAVDPDFELAPAASRLVQRVRTLISLAHFPNPPLQPASSRGAAAASSFRSHNCIIELTCSRLC